MKLERKIFLGFLLFSLIAGVILGAIYAVSSVRSYMASARSWIGRLSELYSERMGDLVSQSKLVYMTVLSDGDALASIEYLAENPQRDENFTSLYLSGAYETIRTRMKNYFIYGQCYRILYYNQLGDVIAIGKNAEWSIDTDVSWTDIDGLGDIPPGGLVLRGIHEDDWGKRRGREVLSVMKRLVGTNLGFFEIQWLKEDLDAVFQLEDGSCDVFFYDGNGTLLYSTAEPQEDYLAYGDGVQTTRSHRAAGVSTDEALGITAVAVGHANLYAALLGRLLPVLLLLLGCFFAFAYLYSRSTAKSLVRPIAALCGIMERTDLDSMTEVRLEEAPPHSSEETQALYRSFSDVMQRLSLAMEREKHLSVLQLEAQMDLLQAQVNPHFIHNVLNAIAAKGMLADDESISRMCASLGKMLRYSTNTKDRLGTVREEAEYLQQYFYLMKYRYGDRLSYSVSIDSSIEEELLPKISLEQIVENAVRHGCEDKTGAMRIDVTGRAENGGWMLNVHDNGAGFSDEKLAELREKLRDVQKRLSKERERVELEIGGMGLINTYARLYLTFGERLLFSMSSDENGTDVGFCVKGEAYVSGSDRG